MSIINIRAHNNDTEYASLRPIPIDTDTSDEQLKYKIRSLNLIKHNPNIFTNRGNFMETMGGMNTVIATLGFGALGVLYRTRVNALRNVSAREGMWLNTFYFLFGSAFGLGYSACYFMKTQMVMNDMFAHYLMKRYSGSADLKRRNVYALRDVENHDECYVFSSSFVNNFHM